MIQGVGRDSGLSAASNLVMALARIMAFSFGSVFIIRGEITVGTDPMDGGSRPTFSAVAGVP